MQQHQAQQQAMQIQQRHEQQQQSGSNSLRPIWKFSSFFQGPVEYQCYQKCFPIIPSQPQMLVELCNKICPFRPTIPECAKCAKIYEQSAPPTPGDFNKKTMQTQPESIVVEPETHAIMFTPEIVVNGYERKQCCYLDKCTTVPLAQKCDPICYEPCDAVCTGRCQVNPQCPHECDRILREQYKLRYRMWLVQKLNDIKQKYRAMATACLLRTRLAFVGEVQNYYQAARGALSDVPLALGDETDSNQIPMNDEQQQSDQQQDQSSNQQ